MATSSNYVYSFWLYSGSNSTRKTNTENIVLDFVKELPSLPHFILSNSYYGSLSLAEELNKLQVRFIMSCQKNRPAFLFKDYLNKQKNMKQGESRFISNGHLVAFYFKDRAKVNFLTNADLVKAEHVVPPRLVQVYRKHMGHVDRVDAILSQCMFSNRNRKWTDAHFKACLKFCVDNCWVIYKQIKKESLPLEDFLMKLACQLIKPYKSETTKQEELVDTISQSNYHFPVKSDKRSRCQIPACFKKDLKSNYFCSACNTCLHIECFSSYHIDLFKK